MNIDGEKLNKVLDAFDDLERLEALKVAVETDMQKLTENKEGVIELKMITESLNEKYGFNEITVAYESSQSYAHNVMIAVEKADNIFTRIWNWIKKMFNKLFGSDGEGSKDKQEKKQRKTLKKVDDVLSFIEKEKGYLHGLKTKTLAEVLVDKFPLPLVINGEVVDQISLSIFKRNLEDISRMNNDGQLKEIEKYVDEGEKAKHVNFKSTDVASISLVNRPELFSTKLPKYIGETKVTFNDTVVIGTSYAWFVLGGKVDSKRYQFATSNLMVSDDVKDSLSKIEMVTELTFENLDAIGDILNSDRFIEADVVEDLKDTIKGFKDAEENNDTKKAKRLVKLIKAVTPLVKDYHRTKTAYIENYLVFLKEIRDTIEDAKNNASVSNESETIEINEHTAFDSHAGIYLYDGVLL